MSSSAIFDLALCCVIFIAVFSMRVHIICTDSVHLHVGTMPVAANPLHACCLVDVIYSLKCEFLRKRICLEEGVAKK